MGDLGDKKMIKYEHEYYNVKNSPHWTFAVFAWALFLGSILITVHSGIWQHEITHQTIFASYGIESEIRYNYFPSNWNWSKLYSGELAATYPNHTQYNELCKEDCQHLQNEVEIVGYHISLFYVVPFILFILWALFSLMHPRNELLIVQKQVNDDPQIKEEPEIRPIKPKALNSKEDLLTRKENLAFEIKRRYSIGE